MKKFQFAISDATCNSFCGSHFLFDVSDTDGTVKIETDLTHACERAVIAIYINDLVNKTKCLFQDFHLDESSVKKP